MQTSSNRARALPAPGIVLSGRVWIVVLAALLALGAALSARAQPAGDPPSRAARLSEVERPGLAVQHRRRTSGSRSRATAR